MNKTTLFSAFLILLSGFTSGQTPNIYYCNFTNQPVLIDGIADEVWSTAHFSPSFVDISFPPKETPYLNTHFKMLWDNNYLYIFATLEEHHLTASLKNYDDIIYRDNDFEVFIDPNGDSKNYFEIEINSYGTIMDLMLEKPYNKGGSANLTWNTMGMKKAVRCNGTNNDPTDTDSCWSLEMAIPWEALKQHKPVPSDVWRMNFSRVQWEYEIKDGQYVKKKGKRGNNLPEHNWVWSPQGKINMHIPEKWGYVHFVKKQTPVFWVWMGANKSWSNKKWDSTFIKLKSVGITGILISSDKEVLTRVIPIANKYNIQVHAWFWTMNRGEAKPNWLSVNQKGESLSDKKAYVNYYKFMCPALPAVKTYLHDKVNELTEIPGLSGIHFDYIRYVDVILPVALQPKYNLVQNDIMPEFDYGYHPYMRKLYKKKYGADPFELSDPSHDSTWLWFRLHELDKTVIELKNQIKSRGLSTSSAVFPTPEMSRRMVRQNWDSWKLDYYFPMVYHNFYNENIEWIEKVSREDKNAIGEKSKLFTGLYVPSLKKRDDLTRAIDAALKGGADGVAFFDYNALDEPMLQQIKTFSQKRSLITK
jgi:uncharacterized lipoprotein YddW (UPF0748 family)